MNTNGRGLILVHEGLEGGTSSFPNIRSVPSGLVRGDEVVWRNEQWNDSLFGCPETIEGAGDLASQCYGLFI